MDLVSAVLTRQTSWQIVLEVYYVTTDLTMLGQCIWYTYGSQAGKKLPQAYQVIIGEDENCTADGISAQDIRNMSVDDFFEGSRTEICPRVSPVPL